MERPALHALLNLSSATLLVFGWLAIRGRGPWARDGKNVSVHARFMLAAFATSTVFLASYLEYHGRVGSIPFWGEGWLAAVYFVVLVPHIVLAAVMVPPILITLTLALRRSDARHRAWARWTLPVWLYVSATGVLVWWLNHGLRPVVPIGPGP